MKHGYSCWKIKQGQWQVYKKKKKEHKNIKQHNMVISSELQYNNWEVVEIWPQQPIKTTQNSSSSKIRRNMNKDGLSLQCSEKSEDDIGVKIIGT